MCSKQCYEECGDCEVVVDKKLPYCEHTARLLCCLDPETYLCQTKCSKMLPCEHSCPNVCSASCGNCQVQVSSRVLQSETAIHLQVVVVVVVVVQSNSTVANYKVSTST
jgi:hypothetical protein